jgi:hypothetical protein
MLLLAIAGLSAREMVDASYLFEPRLFFGQDGNDILPLARYKPSGVSPESDPSTHCLNAQLIHLYDGKLPVDVWL